MDGIDDDQLREAHDIFGPAFDPNEFDGDDDEGALLYCALF